MDEQEYILAMFEQGMLCDCNKDPVWDRIYDADNRFAGYELQHKVNCTGRLKAAETMKELSDGEV